MPRMDKKSDAAIPYFTIGSGEEALIFIHGFLDGAIIWDHLIDKINAPGYEIVTLDMPGFGDACEWTGALNLSTLADAVATVVDALKKKCVLVGQSMGCQVAELVALLRPDVINGMLLLTPVPLKGLPVNDAAKQKFYSYGENEPAIREMRKRYFPEISPEWLDRLVANSMRIKHESCNRLFEAWSEGDERGIPPFTGTMPVTIAYGDEDPFVTRELVEEVLKPHFPKAEIVMVPGGNHWMHVSVVDKTVDVIDAFIKCLKQKIERR